MIPPPGTDRNRLVSTTAGLFLGGLAYVLTLSDYRLSLTRTSLQSGLFSTFYDQQARAFMDGHVDLPANSLGIEGFVHDGKTFMYFPPWPAILRLPVLLTTHEYDGRLTLLSMALAWIVLAVMVAKLAWLLSLGSAATGRGHSADGRAGRALPRRGDGRHVPHLRRRATVGLHRGLHVGRGRGRGRPVLADAPARRADAARHVVAVRLRADLCRHPGDRGLGDLARGDRLGLFWRLRPRGAGRHPCGGACSWPALVPLALSIALNEYKFGSVYSFPLQDQVWTALSEHRRDALAANAGGLTGPQFFTTSFMAYLRPDGIRFVDYFPFITLPAHPAPAYHGAVVDQAYRTGSVTAFMPLLMLMSLVALVAVARPRARRELALLRLPVAVSILITGGVMAYGYYAARYASEFVPALVLGGAITTGSWLGSCASPSLAGAGPRRRRPRDGVLTGRPDVDRDEHGGVHPPW